MNRRAALPALVLVASAGVIAGCGSGATGPSAGGASTTSTGPTTTVPTTTVPTTTVPYEAETDEPSYYGVTPFGGAPEVKSYLRWDKRAAGTDGSLEVGKASRIILSGLPSGTYALTVRFLGGRAVDLDISGHGVRETLAAQVLQDGVQVDFPAVGPRSGDPQAETIMFTSISGRGY